ncbi:TnsA endonuclease N-terminal domain-containing protein [Paraburkholderia nemoris]|uniref:TnsA endonuclease N-terminal domain-containing protein n=1 Tax=Paraburkholderia nemoris TaxID=2793076 RepID=UPI001B0028CE|nr:TnsA endonuclease N-terminal domain-containing protein [Paraburkholderia nemoris]CAE6851382.1 hypothetical protein R75777_07562 [Paraburkholderia nemoris]
MKILELPTTFQTPMNRTTPRRDAYGVLHGVEYVPFLDATTMSMGTRATFGGVKVGRLHQARSLNETRAIAAFNFNSYVLDIRERYPIYDQAAYDRAKLRGVRLARRKVTTCDIVLTLALPPDNHLHYHVVSVKDVNDKLMPKKEERQQRERQIVTERGWTWEVLRGAQFSKRAYGNHMLMKTWIGNSNIWNLYAEAEVFSQRIKTHSIRGTLIDVVERQARYLGTSTDHAFELFVAAVSFGMLRISHEEHLRVDGPLNLQREMQ